MSGARWILAIALLTTDQHAHARECSEPAPPTSAPVQPEPANAPTPGPPLPPGELTPAMSDTEYPALDVSQALNDGPDVLGEPPTEYNQQLRVDKVDRRNWFGITPETDPLGPFMRLTQRLNDKTGLTVGGAYTMLLQQASGGPGDRTAAAGDIDLLLSWKREFNQTDYVRVNSSFEYRFQIGDITPAALGPEIGTLVRTTNGFNERPPVVKELFYDQMAFDGRLRVIAGRIDPENYVGGHRMQSANTFFLNRAFSSNPAIAFPSIGIGAGAALKPVDWMYISAGASDVNADIKRTGFDTAFSTGEVFSFAELGFLNNIRGWGSGRQRLSLWHTDASSVTNQPADEGICFTADQELGPHAAAFARLAYANGTLTNVRHLYEAGVGFKGVTGIENDYTGVAIAYAAPPQGRAETIIEAFQRFQLGLRMELTVGAQLIIHPGNAPQAEALGVFECRYRISF
ncbi:MAG: carbohydrate porin [Planctomycetes bacterium]|nr:carbohydrate porin [Planctomycetota bacterium]